MSTRDYPQTEFPTRAETDADEHSPQAGWFLTGPAGSALADLLVPATRIPARVDNAQHSD